MRRVALLAVAALTLLSCRDRVSGSASGASASSPAPAPAPKMGPTMEERGAAAVLSLQEADRALLGSRGLPLPDRMSPLIRVEQAAEAAKAFGVKDLGRAGSKAYASAFELGGRLRHLEEDQRDTGEIPAPEVPKLFLPEPPMTRQDARELAMDLEDREFAREAYRESQVEHGRAVAEATQAHQEAMKAYHAQVAERAASMRAAEKARAARKSELVSVRKSLTSALAAIDAGDLEGKVALAQAPAPVAVAPVAPAPPARPADRGSCLRSCIATCNDDAACERGCATTKCR